MCLLLGFVTKLSAAVNFSSDELGLLRRNRDGRATTRLVLEVDVGQRLPVAVADDEAPAIQFGVGAGQRLRRAGRCTDLGPLFRRPSAYRPDALMSRFAGRFSRGDA